MNAVATIPEETLREIVLWCLWENHSAILKPDVLTASLGIHVFWYNNTTSGVSNYHFPWIYDTTETTTTANWQFTTEYNPDFVIHYDWEHFTCELAYEKRVWNYLTVENSWYTTPYMPTASYQPATKAYVDAVAAGSVQVPAITNNTTWTTLTLQQEWVGTQAQYNQITPINWVIYNIIPSS